MKTTRTFKGSWFILAVAIAIVVAEVVAWKMSGLFSFHFSPVTVAFAAAGLVAVAASLIFEGTEVD
jgi:hypothetical protein